MGTARRPTRRGTKVTKTGSARVIDIDAETLRVLKTHKSDRGAISLDLPRADSYVFSDDQGAIRVPDAVTSRWTRRLDWVCAKIEGLPRVTLKGLRHTHATLLLELGEHPKDVQERLGHSTITTTMNIYSHVTPTMQKAAVDRFAAHLETHPAGAQHIFRHMSPPSTRAWTTKPQVRRPGAVVREGGVEPPRPFGHTDLNRARLPIPPPARNAATHLTCLHLRRKTGGKKATANRKTNTHPPWH